MKRINNVGLIFLSVALFASCGWQIGTQLSNTVSRTRISSNGVTWRFSQPRKSGQFANGDYWVLAPVTIIDITPRSIVDASGRTRNGSMLNPEISLQQGFDSMIMGPRDSYYDASKNAGRPHGKEISNGNPITIKEPASLISAVSQELDGNNGSRVRVMSVLTILDDEPPEGSFRPCYAGTDKTVSHQISEADFDHLPRLVPPSAGMPDIDEVSGYFDLPWIDYYPTWLKQLFNPPENLPNYGQTISLRVSDAALMLCLDVDDEKKKILAMRIVQLGLDNYGLTKLPGGTTLWEADGGHMSGRAFPIVFAASVLQDQEMLNRMKKTGGYAYSYGYHEGHLPNDYLHFGEIDQTFTVTQRDIDRMAGGIVPGVWEPDSRAAAEPYAQSDLGIADWGIRHAGYPAGDNKYMESEYRRVNSPAWIGFILASRIMGMKRAWNHQPLFDYADRWMEYDLSLGGGGQTPFIDGMWSMYRKRF
jgi:hypothetical protein